MIGACALEKGDPAAELLNPTLPLQGATHGSSAATIERRRGRRRWREEKEEWEAEEEEGRVTSPAPSTAIPSTHYFQ